MALFPGSSTWPITTYALLTEGGKPLSADVSPQALRNAIDACGRLPRLPTDMHVHTIDEFHGWAGLGVEDMPVIVGQHAIFMRRSFLKKPPKSTLKEMIADACEQKRRDLFPDSARARIPAAVKRDITEEITNALLRETMPSIRNIPILLDTQSMRFIVLARGGGATGIAAEVARVVRHATGVGMVWASELGRHIQTVWTFPEQALPDDAARMFTTDLVTHASVVDTLAVDGVMPFSVRLGESVTLALSGKQRLSAKGEAETEKLLDERSDGDDCDVSKLALEFTDGYGTWGVTVDSDAHLLRVSMPSFRDEDAPDASDVLLRAQACWRAVEMQQALIYAFLQGVMRPTLMAEPALFPIGGHDGPDVQWVEGHVEHPAPKGGEKQGTMFDGAGRVVSVTLTSENARRAVEMMDRLEADALPPESPAATKDTITLTDKDGNTLVASKALVREALAYRRELGAAAVREVVDAVDAANAELSRGAAAVADDMRDMARELADELGCEVEMKVVRHDTGEAVHEEVVQPSDELPPDVDLFVMDADRVHMTDAVLFVLEGDVTLDSGSVGVLDPITVTDCDAASPAADLAPPIDRLAEARREWNGRYDALVVRTLTDAADSTEGDDHEAIKGLLNEPVLLRSVVLSHGDGPEGLGTLLVQLLEEAGVEFFPEDAAIEPTDTIPPQPPPGAPPAIPIPYGSTEQDVADVRRVLAKHADPDRSPEGIVTRHLRIGAKRAREICDYLRALDELPTAPKRSRAKAIAAAAGATEDAIETADVLDGGEA